MKSLKVIALAALAGLFIACSSGPFDKSKVKELQEKAFSLTAEDYPEVVTQLEGLLTYFEQTYTPQEIKDSTVKLANGEEPFGADTEYYKAMNLLDSALTGMEDQMDDATKQAYDKYKEHRKKVYGF